MKSITIAIFYICAVITLAHFFAPPGYDWTRNTISELASQGHGGKWLMQIGFIGFGILVLWGIARALSAKQVGLAAMPVGVYGAAILLSGIFCTAPIDPSIEFSQIEASWHSAFAALAGISLCTAIVWNAAVSQRPGERFLHFAFFAAIAGLSWLFFLAEDGSLATWQGVVQRALFLSGFPWLVLWQHWVAPTMVRAPQTA